MRNFFADTETSGFAPERGAEIVELSVVDQYGVPVVDTLVRTRRPIPADATKVHGIDDSMVAGAPLLEDLLRPLRDAILSEPTRIVFYNSAFDTRFFPSWFWSGIRVDCAMNRMAAFRAARGLGKTSVKLAQAAETAGHVWTGDAHRAMADALATRSVWAHLDHHVPIVPPGRFVPTVEGYLANLGLRTDLRASEAAISADNAARNRPVKAGTFWTNADDDDLRHAWKSGTRDVARLAETCARTPLAVALRIRKLFPAVTEAEVGLQDGRYVGQSPEAAAARPVTENEMPIERMSRPLDTSLLFSP